MVWYAEVGASSHTQGGCPVSPQVSTTSGAQDGRGQLHRGRPQFPWMSQKGAPGDVDPTATCGPNPFHLDIAERLIPPEPGSALLRKDLASQVSVVGTSWHIGVAEVLSTSRCPRCPSFTCYSGGEPRSLY